MNLVLTTRMLLTLTLLGLVLAHGPGVFKAENPRVWLEAGQAHVYATLVNQENKAVKVIAADSPVAQRVELRQGKKVIQTLEVPARGRLELKPGGYTLVLLKLSRSLEPGDLVPILLRLDDGDVFAVLAEVRR